MIFFLTIFFIPLMILILFYLNTKIISIKSLFIICSGLLLTSTILTLISYSNQVSDQEIWNGIVVNKVREEVSCEHSYSCNCRESCSGSGKNRSCSTICDTCYDHTHDYDYNVYTSNSEKLTIKRIDRQGVKTPPRFDLINIGEPTAVKHSYNNYILGSPDSLFIHHGLVEKYKKYLTDYPENVYDYYHLNRVLSINGPSNLELNEKLSELNSRIGAKKQANVILVIVNNLPNDFYYALEQHWLGGNKNDIIIVMGVENEKIIWTEIMAWTNETLFKVELKDNIIDNKIIDINLLYLIEDSVINLYKRKPMADFEYLKSDIVPSGLNWFIGILVQIVLIGIIIFVMNKNHNMYSRFNKQRY